MNKKSTSARPRKQNLPPNALTYKLAGVDIDAGNALVQAIKPLVRSTRRAGANGEIGGFGGLFDLKQAGFSDPVLVAANDGVGTKLRLAIDLGIHSGVGIDLVAMCVNDLVVQGAEPLFFLDYLATGALNVAEATSIIEGIAKGCRQAGCALIGGETAEMPGLYHGADYDLAGFALGAVERERLLPRADIMPDDVLIGIASSGLHSNGFSLVRKLVEVSGANLKAPAPFNVDMTLGQSLLTPTRIYVKPLLSALKRDFNIKGLAHITGGGLSENIPRILPDNVVANIDLSSIPHVPVFNWLAQIGGIPEAEMLRTFNCGVGMVAIIPEPEAQNLIAHLSDQGELAFRIGHLSPSTGASATGVVNFSGSLQF